MLQILRDFFYIKKPNFPNLASNQPSWHPWPRKKKGGLLRRQCAAAAGKKRRSRKTQLTLMDDASSGETSLTGAKSKHTVKLKRFSSKVIKVD